MFKFYQKRDQVKSVLKITKILDKMHAIKHKSWQYGQL